MRNNILVKENQLSMSQRFLVIGANCTLMYIKYLKLCVIDAQTNAKQYGNMKAHH